MKLTEDIKKMPEIELISGINTETGNTYQLLQHERLGSLFYFESLGSWGLMIAGRSSDGTYYAEWKHPHVTFETDILSVKGCETMIQALNYLEKYAPTYGWRSPGIDV